MQLKSPYSDLLSLRLQDFYPLTLLHTVTRRLMLQKAHGQAYALPYLVSVRFQDLFHSALAVLFTFPSQYLFTIGHYRVFSLAKWSSQIPTELHVLRGTQELVQRSHMFQIRGYHPLWRVFPNTSLTWQFGNFADVLRYIHTSPTTPTSQRPQAWHNIGLGCFVFARRY